MNKLDPFEELLKAKLQDHRVEFNSDSWDAIEKELPPTPTPKSNFYYWIGAAIVVGTISISLFSINNVSDNIIVPPIVPSLSNNDKENDIDTSPSMEPESDNSIPLEETKNEINTTKNKSSDKSTKTELPIYTLNTNEEKLNKNDESKDHLTSGPWEFTSDEIILDNNEKKILTADFTSNKNNSCIDDIITFNSVNQVNITYHWDFDDGTYSDQINPEHAFDLPGTYLIQLTITSVPDPTDFIKSEEYQITINEKPIVEFETTSIENNGIPMILFSYDNIENNSVTWDFGDGSKSKENSPSHRYMQKGNYLATLSASNQYNCIVNHTKTIEVNKVFNLLAPNSFTPNGDGINDYFIPESLKIMEVDFNMTIFNKVGKRVYQSKNIDQPWDGFDQKTSQKCPEGSYVWVVKLTNNNGEIELYKGAVLLLK